MGAYLAESMPPRTAPPGETHRYSNHGYALAAYVVEQVTGLPFDQYASDQILQPLGMSRSGYLLGPPLPEHGLGYFFSFNEECYQTSACEIIAEFREQFLKRFF